MKFIFILLCLTLGQCKNIGLEFLDDPLSDEYIDYLQSQCTTWKAGRNFHRETSMQYVKRLMGVKPLSRHSSTDTLPLKSQVDSLPDGFELEENFDAREKWPLCPTIKEIRDQGDCGSCWALSSVEVMSDRTCILSEGKINFHYSAEDLLSCCSSCGFGCDGGEPTAAFRYWQHNGIVSGGPYNSSQGCVPYEIPPCEHHVDGDRPNCEDAPMPDPKCTRRCESSYETTYDKDLHKAKEVYRMTSTEEAMQELATNGPINAAFDVYSDFLSYKSGVYQKTSGASYVGGHSIRIIGYGTENEVPYWLCANSWNTDWGDKGLFKILRGAGECSIEDELLGGIPAF